MSTKFRGTQYQWKAPTTTFFLLKVPTSAQESIKTLLSTSVQTVPQPEMRTLVHKTKTGVLTAKILK